MLILFYKVELLFIYSIFFYSTCHYIVRFVNRIIYDFFLHKDVSTSYGISVAEEQRLFRSK